MIDRRKLSITLSKNRIRLVNWWKTCQNLSDDHAPKGLSKDPKEKKREAVNLFTSSLDTIATGVNRYPQDSQHNGASWVRLHGRFLRFRLEGVVMCAELLPDRHWSSTQQVLGYGSKSSPWTTLDAGCGSTLRWTSSTLSIPNQSSDPSIAQRNRSRASAQRGSSLAFRSTMKRVRLTWFCNLSKTWLLGN